MKKLLTALCLAASFVSPAQTLFTYGKEKVSADDFMRPFQKNNQGPVTAKTNGGDIGWITVFSLPYELENLAYTTPVGKASNIYRSNAGYHIIKNLGERKALGRIKALQILLALPPNSSEGSKAKLKQRAD